MGGKEQVLGFEIEDSTGKFVTDYNGTLQVWEKYIQKLYDKEHTPDDIEIEDETGVDDFEKGSSIIQCQARQRRQLKT